VGRMERHGGRARIASDPETGTEVELELPARADR
jgi:signal transduction histidine kinase